MREKQNKDEFAQENREEKAKGKWRETTMENACGTDEYQTTSQQKMHSARNENDKEGEIRGEIIYMRDSSTVKMKQAQEHALVMLGNPITAL